MALNVVVAVFTMMFTIFNTVLISFTFAAGWVKTAIVVFSMGFNIFLILFTNFTLNEISDMSIMTICVSLVFSGILIYYFLYITNAMLQETLDEVAESGIMRGQFKAMFASLQGGIVIVQNGKIPFINDLALKILNNVSGLKHFANNITKEEERPSVDSVNQKLFFAYNHKRGKKAQKEMIKKKKKKSQY
jgi:hypothetical protein